jgi:hypothetical protein
MTQGGFRVRSIRDVGALLLAVSLALPMSTCSASKPFGQCEPPPAFRLPQPGEAAPRLYTHWNYAWPGCGTWREPAFMLVPLAFLWPLGVILFSRSAFLGRLARLLFWLEILPLCYAALIIYWAGWVIGKPAVGAFTGGAGVALSAGSWIGDVVRWARARLAVYRGAG